MNQHKTITLRSKSMLVAFIALLGVAVMLLQGCDNSSSAESSNAKSYGKEHSANDGHIHGSDKHSDDDGHRHGKEKHSKDDGHNHNGEKK